MIWLPALAMAMALFGSPQETLDRAPEELLDDLSALRLDPENAYRVRDLTLRRDVISVSFGRGVIAFLEPVEGRVTGAVFVGSGDILAMPPDEVERRQIAKFTGSPILNERFDAAVLRFTDDTYKEVVERIGQRPGDDLRAEEFEALLPWGQNLGNTSRLLNLRLLQDLTGPSNRPMFFAALRGERLGWFDVAYDERNEEEVIMGDSPEPDFDGGVQNVWASFNRRSEARDRTLYGHQLQSDLDVATYHVDTTIAPDGALSASATVGFSVLRGGDRVLPFELSRSLRLSDVRFDGESIPFFQHDPSEGDYEGGILNRFVVVLPRPTTQGEKLEINFDYGGEVLERRGNGVYYVSERVLWYPHIGKLDPATYELSFHYPANNVLVATGRLVGETEGGGLRHSRWESETEYVVAGFNYGDFSVETDTSGDVPIYVHVNNDVETVYEDLALRRAELTERVLRELQGAWRRRVGNQGRVPVLPEFELFSTRRLAGNVARQVRSMLNFFSVRLGDYPYERLSVSQFPVPFSQGWPSLLYVSTMSFFDEEQRARLNLSDRSELLDLEYVLAHEVAHQWFGNQVTWSSYRDQWIGEGFANYMAVLYVEESAGGDLPSSVALERLRRDLLSAGEDGRSHEEGGPVWIGQRLVTRSTPSGYLDTVYPKATWIVHMLRTLLTDPHGGGDDAFVAVVRQYLEEFSGRPASTFDLKDFLERHMTPRMDVEGDGTLDWFFDQWVFGTGVPEYVLEYEVSADEGVVLASGQVVDRRELSFTMPLPIYAESTGGGLDYVGDIIAAGPATDFELILNERPRRLVMDPYRAVLRR